MAVFSNIDFFQDLGKIILDAALQFDSKPIQTYFYTKTQAIFLAWVPTLRVLYDYYVWITCRAWRHRIQALRAQNRVKYEYDFGTDAEESLGKLDKDKVIVNQSKSVNKDLIQLKRSYQVDLLHTQIGLDNDINFFESDYEDYSQDEKQKKAPSRKTPGDSEQNMKEEAETMEVVVYENQRWWLGQGWCDKMLQSERAPWSDLTGHLVLPKKKVPLPSKNWGWITEWQIQHGTPQFLTDSKNKTADNDGSYDPEGWQYGADFSVSKRFTGKPTVTDFVRRRKWVRVCAKIDEEKTQPQTTPETVTTELENQ